MYTILTYLPYSVKKQRFWKYSPWSSPSGCTQFWRTCHTQWRSGDSGGHSPLSSPSGCTQIWLTCHTQGRSGDSGGHSTWSPPLDCAQFWLAILSEEAEILEVTLIDLLLEVVHSFDLLAVLSEEAEILEVALLDLLLQVVHSHTEGKHKQIKNCDYSGGKRNWAWCGYLDAMRVRPNMVALSMRVLFVSKVPCKKMDNNNFRVQKKYIQQKVN